ncbi:MAG TPA: hypothetical protein VG826_09460 [Pirellulales bacterium]|nr:hypothetical protein [Pirellulales bacterium]
MAEKSNNPRWALPAGFNLNIDPRSRYYDPTNPDHPPMPPDDPYSHVYMHRVDGKRAAPWWHINGELPMLPNPGWRQRLSEYCEMTPEGAVKLDIPGAVALSYVHSPTHRSQLETLYLSALDVTAERFRFNLQVYPAAGLSFLRAGAARNGVVVPASPGQPAVVVPRSQLTQTNGVAPGSPAVFSKEFATGGTLLVNFANSFVWQLAGPHSNATNSLINMNLVQPLLSGGGRVITLETLTRTERQLLANLRYYERWRQGWFLFVAVGTNQIPTGPQRTGGAFGGTGLTGFTGQSIGGLGGVAAATGGFSGLGAAGGVGGLGVGVGAGAVAGAAGGGAGLVGSGVLGILQQQVNIDNAQNALNLQVRTLKLLEANLEAGLIDIAQVDLFRQSIETNKATILGNRIGLEQQKDSFKINQLGLPPDIPMIFDDPMIKPFQLIDPRMNELQFSLIDFTERAGTLGRNPSSDEIENVVVDIARLHEQVGATLPLTLEDLRVLDERTPDRTRTMTAAQKSQFLAEKQRLNDRAAEFATRLMQADALLADLREKSGSASAEETVNGAVALASTLTSLTQEISLVRALTRLESIIINPVELSTVDALQIARAHRLDWMNVRAAVVDQWRLICFNANSLRSVLNLTVNGNLGTVGNNPLKFEANNGDLTMGVQFAPPLTRLLQRNNYRQALINYQQVRRTAIQFEDSVNLALRQDMRTLKQYEVNFEIQREAVRIAIRRVDNTREQLNQPPPPVVLGQAPTALGPTSAQNLLSSLQALGDAQNNMMSVWLQHYDERVQLYQDLGIMRLDERGMWIDEPIDQSLAQLEQMYPLPPELPVDWLKDAGLTPPALYPTEGVPPLGGTIEQVQAEAATPETPRPQFDIPRPQEEERSREIEALPAPGEEPPPAPAPDEVMDGTAKETTKKAKQKGWSWPFKKSGTAEAPRRSKTPAAVVKFKQSEDS